MARFLAAHWSWTFLVSGVLPSSTTIAAVAVM
jgi:hypothetical protein